MVQVQPSWGVVVARLVGVGAIAVGLVLTYNLLAPEATRLGPALGRGAARVVGPLMVVLAVPGLVAGAAPRVRMLAGAGAMVAGVSLGPWAWMVFIAEPFIRTIFVAAATLLLLVGIAMTVAAREDSRT
ncbi:MAG: hypothetical protein GKS06_09520 [Acidobacteria bacterium]|nr:hypothetical protein [Acidobacteriota bacterium]